MSYSYYTTSSQPRPGNPFPQRMHAWFYYSSLGTSAYIELGPVAKSRDNINCSCKMKATGKTEVRWGKFNDNESLIGEGKVKGLGLLSTTSILTLASGAQAVMSSASSLRNKGWVIEMKINGKTEKWIWMNNKTSLSKKLISGQKPGMSLVRADGSGPPSATLTPNNDLTGITKSTIGIFEFHGPALTGELGGEFQAFAMLSWMRMTQKTWEKNWISAVT